MKDIDFTTIYNIPEEISGLGYKSHLIGLCLFIALFVCAIPCVLIDENWIKDSIGLVTQSGILVTLGISFIFILCPLYFFIRFVMEIIRTIKSRHVFYSTPNIEYIKLNSDEIFFKNTCPNYDFSIKKSDIISVILDGKVNSVSGIKKSGTPHVTTFVEKLTLTIKTANESYTIYPQIKRKQLPKGMIILDEFELLKNQIEFYKNYFDNFYVLFDFDGTDTLSEAVSMVNANKLENEIPKFLKH